MAKMGIKICDIAGTVEGFTGKKPSLDSVKRWIRDGYRGVKLRVAGPLHFRFTREEWVEKFLLDCGDAITQEHEESEADEILEREFGFKKV